MTKVYTDQPIFDAIAAAVKVCRVLDGSEPKGVPLMTIDVAKFIEAFNGHRDRALCTSLGPPWQPIETAPVEPWSDQLPSYYRFTCLLQTARGDVSEGWAYYVAPPRSRPTKAPVMRWANRIGVIVPKYWMPMPAPKQEP